MTSKTDNDMYIFFQKNLLEGEFLCSEKYFNDLCQGLKLMHSITM